MSTTTQSAAKVAQTRDHAPVATLEDLREVTLFLAGWIQTNCIWPEMNEQVELLQRSGVVGIGHRRCSQWVMDKGPFDDRVTHWRKIEGKLTYNEVTQEELIALAHKPCEVGGDVSVLKG